MFRRLLFIILSVSLALPFNGRAQQTKDLAQFIDPFIGTGGHGHTYPGAQCPFGMIQLSPDTRLEGWDGCSAYHYSDTVVYGFSHTHLSGTGCSDYGDILLMPFTGDVHWKNSEYASLFHHSSEKAGAGYYSVLLEKNNIKAELTATPRAGFHRYTYPAGEKSSVLLDLKHRDEVLESSVEIIGTNEVTGMRRSKAWADNQIVYFAIQFSKPFDNRGIAIDDQLQGRKDEAKGKNLKAFFTFNTSDGEPLLVKVGISAVSIEGARKNLKAEIPEWKFDEIREKAYQSWNNELNKIQVEGNSRDDKVVFYTALYHCMLAPNLYNDVDGSYLGRDFKPHQSKNFNYYTVFSLWDTYRANHPLFTLIDEKRTNDFINTFITQYEQGGLLPVWELSSNETYCMIGYHSVPVIADAYVKDIRAYDVSKAYVAMKHSASMDIFGLTHYRQNGFISGDQDNESVSKTLEYAYDDWCIAQLAKALNNNDDYDAYIKRAQSYKNLFDPSTKFLRPRINGGWYSPFDPTEVNNHYTEANAWQYTFYVPQDIDGFSKLLGGKNSMAAKLDEMFNASDKTTGRDQSDITGMIGQYAHGNEPSHHMTYLYNYTGQSWKTQQKVHQVMTELYRPSPDGLSGNEDCGQMSAWFVLSAMGFYPVCPGQAQYAIGTPYFDKVVINQENGKQFTLEAKNLSYNSFYVQSAQWNGLPYNRSFISHQMIRKGGSLVLDMGPTPNKQWGSTDYDVPRTFINNHLIVTVPFIEAASRTFTDSLLITMGSVDAKLSVYYTLDGSEPTASSLRYDKPFTIKEQMTIKALACNEKAECSQVVVSRFNKIPHGRKIILNTPYEHQYTAGGPTGLIDGIRGTTNWRIGNWQGYENNDLDALVDLGKIQAVSKVSVGFLQDIGAWIWFPKEVLISVSSDGDSFRQIAAVKTEIPDNDYKNQLKEFSAPVQSNIRYIQVKAKKYGKIPAWHPGAGGDSHIFADEISVE
jgi:predicted alpha-1,2-mannosidase